MLITLVAGSARATGFTGTYSQTEWTLSSNTTINAAPTAYACGVNYTSNCFEAFDSGGGNATLLGDLAPNGSTAAVTTWLSDTPANTGGSPGGYKVTFTLQYLGESGAGNYGYYAINGLSPNPSQQVFAGENPKSFVIFMGFTDTLTFGVRNADQNNLASIKISGFNATPVPAPLPAAGAASAFGFSRRLRRRCQRKHTGTIAGRSRVAAHPAAYLNLSPEALHSLPLSFSYPPVPTTVPMAGGPAGRDAIHTADPSSSQAA